MTENSEFRIHLCESNSNNQYHVSIRNIAVPFSQNALLFHIIQEMDHVAFHCSNTKM